MKRDDAIKTLTKHGFVPGQHKTDPNGDPAVRAEIKAACNALKAEPLTPAEVKAVKGAAPKG